MRRKIDKFLRRSFNRDPAIEWPARPRRSDDDPRPWHGGKRAFIHPRERTVRRRRLLERPRARLRESTTIGRGRERFSPSRNWLLAGRNERYLNVHVPRFTSRRLLPPSVPPLLTRPALAKKYTRAGGLSRALPLYRRDRRAGPPKIARRLFYNTASSRVRTTTCGRAEPRVPRHRSLRAAADSIRQFRTARPSRRRASRVLALGNEVC